MPSIERVETVLQGRLPDRVPTDLHNFMVVAQNSGLPFSEFFQNGEAMAEGQVQAWREYGHDVLFLENGTAALAEACGCDIIYLEDSAPVVHKPLLRNWEDLDNLRFPDPYQAHPLKELLRATRLVRQETGDRAFIIGRGDQGPFSLASLLIGLETFLVELAERKHTAEMQRLLAFCEETCYRYCLAQVEQGAHMTSIGESLAGPDTSSPRVYREYAWVYDQRLAARLKKQNVRLAYHICGKANPILADMVTTGAAILELDYKNDLAAVKQATRRKATVLGVLDPSGVMALGTPELVAEKSRETIEILGEGGGLILGPGCALPPTTPAENIHAMIEAAQRYGRYA